MLIRFAIFSCVTFSCITFNLFAQQDAPPKDWFLRDPQTEHIQGLSVEKVYTTLLKDRPSRKVIVAVIDGGIDIHHEDLQSVIWTNEKEIPDNGIDDDKNGYIDDVHGWNFIGGKNGNVNEDNYELTREYVRLRDIYEAADMSKLTKKQKAEYESYKKIRNKFERLRDKNRQEYEIYKSMYKNLTRSIDTLKSILKVDSLRRSDLDSLQPSSPKVAFAKGFISSILRRVAPETSVEEVRNELKENLDYYKVIVEYGYNPEFNSREIIGDVYTDLSNRYYGNNDVKGPEATHGTHVAGTIGADRKNDLGIKGIADNIWIMPVRAVPNGDERDKDIANAIRYAVDNGANIINMSFGKSFSPEKAYVDDAVRYAESKGVILIHAAGNENEDNDKEPNYPTRRYLDGKEAKNWIEVGASSWRADDGFVANFSNYGKKSVDVFAPGVDIYSTTPENTYKNESGTSMASPTVAGVTAILLSYFPDLTPSQVVDIIKKSVRTFDGLKVQKPGGGRASFDDLSTTGGMVNAWEAVRMASEMQKVPGKGQ